MNVAMNVDGHDYFIFPFNWKGMEIRIYFACLVSDGTQGNPPSSNSEHNDEQLGFEDPKNTPCSNPLAFWGPGALQKSTATETFLLTSANLHNIFGRLRCCRSS